MVQIRTLTPSVRIALPQRQRLRKPSNIKRDTVVRSLREFPPPTPQATQCRLWQGSVDGNGYGKRKMRQADGSWRMISMHRWVMETVMGRRLRKTEVILHACDQPLCFRIDHLSVGTMASNNADARRKGRAKKPPVNRLRGEANGRNKIPPRLHPVIVRRYLAGTYVGTLATEYGVHEATIHRILRITPWPEMDRLPPHARRLAGRSARSDGPGPSVPPLSSPTTESEDHEVHPDDDVP